MKLKTSLIAVGFMLFSPLYASNLFPVSKEQITINQCPITYTQNALDLAISKNGYFIVSNGKKQSEPFFTRYGKFLLDEEHYIKTEQGNYLFRLPKENSKHLSKIKISPSHLPPKATTHVSLGINLAANAEASDEIKYSVRFTVNDDLNNQDVLSAEFAKISTGVWSAKILFHDNRVLDEGRLIFTNKGTLERQEGLKNVYWPVDYGFQELKIDFHGTTQYGEKYGVFRVSSNGYSLGHLIGLSIDEDGKIGLRYSNGHSKLIKGRIAIANFINAGSLERVSERLYQATEASGLPSIDWDNGKDAILSGVLEEETCLKKL